MYWCDLKEKGVASGLLASDYRCSVFTEHNIALEQSSIVCFVFARLEIFIALLETRNSRVICTKEWFHWCHLHYNLSKIRRLETCFHQLQLVHGNNIRYIYTYLILSIAIMNVIMVNINESIIYKYNYTYICYALLSKFYGFKYLNLSMTMNDCKQS